MTTTDKIVLYLHKHGPSDSVSIGSVMENRTGRRVSASGGGDYAAQMMLGRMRKQGYVHVANYEGSSRWELTQAGLQHARKIA